MTILNGLARPEDALAIAGKPVEALSVPIDSGGRSARVPPSIGASVYPDHGTDPDALIRLADRAMYQAKSVGGGGVRLWDEAAATA